jgi:hypothetical protein
MTTKLCYIAGAGRSGSTLLGELLGQLPEVQNLGELVYLPDALTVEGWKCGCGEAITDCTFWAGVIAGMDRPLDPAGAEALRELWRSEFRTRHLPRLWWRSSVRHADPVPAYSAFVADVLGAIQSGTSPRVVVDSSKWAAAALIVLALGGADVFVVHLVRDPRAVAFSWSRRRPAASGRADGEMERYGTAGSMVRWMVSGLAAESFVRLACRRGHFVRVRYEDLVADPAGTVAAVERFLREPSHPLAFTAPDTVVLEPTHSACGNPSRFRTGPVTIADDDEWRDTMPRVRRALIAAACAPMLWWYRYPLLGRRRGRPRLTPRPHARAARAELPEVRSAGGMGW